MHVSDACLVCCRAMHSCPTTWQGDAAQSEAAMFGVGDVAQQGDEVMLETPSTSKLPRRVDGREARQDNLDVMYEAEEEAQGQSKTSRE